MALDCSHPFFAFIRWFSPWKSKSTGFSALHRTLNLWLQGIDWDWARLFFWSLWTAWRLKNLSYMFSTCAWDGTFVLVYKKHIWKWIRGSLWMSRVGRNGKKKSPIQDKPLWEIIVVTLIINSHAKLLSLSWIRVRNLSACVSWISQFLSIWSINGPWSFCWPSSFPFYLGHHIVCVLYTWASEACEYSSSSLLGLSFGVHMLFLAVSVVSWQGDH